MNRLPILAREMSKIEWTHFTFNPWWGCSKISAGCKNCYAEKLDARFQGHHWGDKAERRFFGSKHWDQPLRWNRKAEKEGVRYRVFCASMADVFEIHPIPEENAKLDDARRRLWHLIEKTPHLDWLLLTKRPENHELVPLAWQTGSRRPPNVWLGATAENQEQADIRIPILLEAKWPAVRFVSHEPALETVNIGQFVCEEAPLVRRLLSRYYSADGFDETGSQPEQTIVVKKDHGIDWLITGAESGPGSRPMDEDCVRVMRDQCTAARIPFFFKQRMEGGKKISLPLLDGVQHTAFPEVEFTKLAPPELAGNDREVERTEDMSPDGKLSLLWCDDGDLIVTVRESQSSGSAMASVEFCISGGHSPQTMSALRLLFVSMEADNKGTR